MDDIDRRLQHTILDLLTQRSPDSGICPTEVAREVGAEEDWRGLMEPTRQAAEQLVAAGQVEITQSGEVVDPGAVTGPIRIRRKLG